VEGLGFAIPISDVQAIITDIIENGEVTDKAYLAITSGTMTAQMADQYEIDLDKGVFVYSVVKGGAGDRAGLRLGDIITEMDGKTIDNMTDLNMAKKGHKAGETVSLTYYREGEYHTTELTFDEQPETTGEEAQTQPQPQTPERYEDYYNQTPDEFEDLFRYFFGRGW
jgi:serine protease Do